MTILVNDKQVEVADGLTVAEVAQLNGVGAGGAAIAVNNKVVRRAEWPEVKLQENDNVVIINAAYGG